MQSVVGKAVTTVWRLPQKFRCRAQPVQRLDRRLLRKARPTWQRAPKGMTVERTTMQEPKRGSRIGKLARALGASEAGSYLEDPEGYLRSEQRGILQAAGRAAIAPGPR